ncbi:MAG: hypothetical protein UX10_C0012G0007 [Candidatus Magasanikbacteria bacterium GW2011_GWA2_45_39]|uniref:Uncharacterized protein n=2 Tax=Candidatus Magasanikiibacteriota TaxID=1752731 RepID=A0A0G1MY91_9BACT|nr:MAG: hypothetical protein UX10_C0012G0007 [Candidatus Magasanikbacteria bacterium GW2011_GWA2_45_39]KKU13351.1 MAG: hypothetical protein UX20_C0024G0011 [Candidatus Magasanikbacteria bacterium GW2011_GWC2_45_8]HBW73699.1 hypothetical protein [Candidatus Magasanikbacteria bacterium]
MPQTKTIVGVKELRENLDTFIAQINKGVSFTVVKRSKPVFIIMPITANEEWEEVSDFTKIKKGGIKIEEILSRL